MSRVLEALGRALPWGAGAGIHIGLVRPLKPSEGYLKGSTMG